MIVLYYVDIKYQDVANGIGVRVSLFVSGCRRYCPECFNKEAWDFKYGKPFTDKEITFIESKLQLPQVRGLSLLGGEPMELENVIELWPLCQYLKTHYPDKDIWCYTGYTFEELWVRENSATRKLLDYIDILVDGDYQKDKHDLSLRFRGSSNQRLIDIKKTFKQRNIVLAEEYM